MIPAALVGQLEQGIGDFLRASFESTTPGFESAIADLVAERGAVTKGPYVQVFLPFRPGSRPDWFLNVPLEFTPHRHQERAFERLGAESKRSTLIATGTGSGKTEAFLHPILDHCLANAGRPGIKAIILYPMNALASDQALRLGRLIHRNERLRGAVTAGLYVGEDEGGGGAHQTMGPDHIVTDRKTLRLKPPDILLTNYKMLDYSLVRPRDRSLWKDSVGGSLRFLVVDEIHSFDGAQGTDLACLIRRLKHRLRVRPGTLCCVGTSATLGGREAGDELRRYAAEVFGEPFDPDAVVVEERLEIDAFRGDSVLRFWSVPGAADRDALDPSRYGTPAEFVAAQARLWFSGPIPGDAGGDAWRVALGTSLLEHVMLDNVLRRLRGAPRALDDLVADMGTAAPALREDPGLGRAAVLSFLALISAARRWRPETAAARALREADGKPRPTEPFLQVRLQLWLRELRRMVATVGTRPRLRFSDDLSVEQRGAHLPVIHCRECGVMGWATLVERSEPGVFHADLQRFYRAYFARDPRVHYIFPVGAFASPQEAERHGTPRRLRTSELVALGGSEDPGEGELVPVIDVQRSRTPEGGRPRLDRDCLFCGSTESLTLLGFQAARLTSVFIDQLFASPYNDDKKLLAFSDSVQDASHRASFFGAYTWRFNVRLALARVLREVRPEGRSLAELVRDVAAWWRGPGGGLDDAAFVATFIAPDMRWLRDYDTLLETGDLPPGTDLVRSIERRLAWEIFSEFGLQARIGRSLPRTGTAVAEIDPAALAHAATGLLDRLRNEVGGLRDLEPASLARFLAGFAAHLRDRGGLLHGELPERYVADEDTYVFRTLHHLPALGPRSRLPALLATRSGARHLDSLCGPRGGSWYERWCAATLGAGMALQPDPGHVYAIALPALVAAGLLECRQDRGGAPVYGLRPEALRVTTRVHHVRCERCRYETAVAAHEDDRWTGTPCLSARCLGNNSLDRGPRETYFGRLYRTGDVQRIFAAEHTGLLKRAERERLEDEFKEERARKPWYPNLLSCTPTLEMGIDVGDLSTAILCSVPPRQANYLQRIGRAGRRDGNALVLAVANARPHDLYFYTEPEEMVAAEVSPPGIYLDASAVLERQLTAFAFDRWAASDVPEDALPARMHSVHANLTENALGKFPRNFTDFVNAHRAELVEGFLAMFAGAISEPTQAWLRRFAAGEEEGNSLAWRIQAALHEDKKFVDARAKRIKALTDAIKAKKKQPQDEATREEIDEFEKERSAVRALRKQLDERDTMSFFTDEGLVPNYAFPEAPVRLRSVIWRERKRAAGEEEGRRYESWSYEYDRPAAAALSELAPDNEFYASGRQVRIDQVDIATAAIESWRFCDSCHYSEPVTAGDQRKTCPACASPLWPDPGQIHPIVRLKQVFANTNDRKSRAGDDREERRARYYARQTLMTFKSADIDAAWQVDSDELPFAFEYLRKATFRELNFGERSTDGTENSIAGVRENRRGFTICKHCGKVQERSGDPEHALGCPARKKEAAANFSECVYLYREFSSEAVRILLPLVDFATERQTNSFLASLRVGLRERFGGRVDHLRTLVTSEPVPGTPLRKQFVVIFDSVPGGTGYLKELLREPRGVFDVLSGALDKLARCRCASEPGKDGCYRCLFAYREAEATAVSRSAAVALLTKILAERDKVKRVRSLGDVSVEGLLDSALEARFLEALRRLGTPERPSHVTKAIVAGKPGYRWTIGQQAWHIEPQRDLPPGTGLPVGVSIDFLFHPARVGAGSPVAVFLDGWAYHRERVGLDMFQRMSLLASGKYDAWSFTWQDVAEVLEDQGQVEPATNLLWKDGDRLNRVFATLGHERLPPTLRARLAERPLAWFRATLGGEVTADEWRKLAHLTLATQLQRPKEPEKAAFASATEELCPAAIRMWLDPGGEPSVLTHWPATEERPFTLLAHATEAAMRAAVEGGAYDGFRVLARLHDTGDGDEAVLRKTWRGFLRLFDFLREVRAAWFLGRNASGELDLSGLAAMHSAGPGESGGAWRDLEAEVGAAFRPIVAALASTELPLPEVGVDLPDATNRACGAMAEIAWPDARIGVATEDELASGAKPVDPRWRIFTLGDLTNGVAPLVTALDDALGRAGAGRREET